MFWVEVEVEVEYFLGMVEVEVDVCNASRRDVMEGGEWRVENKCIFFFLFLGGFFRIGEEKGKRRRGEEEDIVGR